MCWNVMKRGMGGVGEDCGEMEGGGEGVGGLCTVGLLVWGAVGQTRRVVSARRGVGGGQEWRGLARYSLCSPVS